MRRADRLFQLVQLIRGRRLTTAAWLAARLEISLRSVYRDIADLQRQGVPIEGEAGVGYRIGKGFDLAPLMFSSEQAQALAASVRIAQMWMDAELAVEAQDALSKVMSVLPASARAAVESLPLYTPPDFIAAGQGSVIATHLQALRQAAQQRHICALHYQDANEQTSQRRVQPLGIFYWGHVWTLAAWCELRQDFRSFRVDRITQIDVQDQHFPEHAERGLAAFLRNARARDRQSGRMKFIATANVIAVANAAPPPANPPANRSSPK